VRWNKAQGYQSWKGADGPKALSWLGHKGRMTDDGLAIDWHLGSAAGGWRWAVDREDSHWEPWPIVTTEGEQAKIDPPQAGATVQLDKAVYAKGPWINKNRTLTMAPEGTGFNSRVSSTSDPKSFVYISPLPDDLKGRIAATVIGKILNGDLRQGKGASDPN